LKNIFEEPLNQDVFLHSRALTIVKLKSPMKVAKLVLL